MRLSVAMAVACLAVTTLSAHEIAAAAIKRETNIPAQSLDSALAHFAKDRGLQLVYASEEVGSLTTAGAVGILSASEALTQLLSGTGLTYRYLDEQTVTVQPIAAVPAGRVIGGKGAIQESTAANFAAGENAFSETAESNTEPPFWRRFRLAQAEQSTAGAQSAAGSVPSSSDRSFAVIDEIIVTAQKREERLQDVPISISVLTGTQLDQSSAAGVTDALRRVPGVTVDELVQGGGTFVAMRGVAAANGSYFGSSPIGYYLDTLPFGLVRSAIAPDPNVYDLDRIEVLRGPQGTLYGANAQGGVVRVLTHDADPDKLEFKARATGSATERGRENYSSDMALNLPLIEGKLAARAVVGYKDLGGWIDKPTKADANDAEALTSRLKVNASLSEQMSVGLSAWISRTDTGAPPFSDDQGRNPARDVEQTENDFDLFGATIRYDFPHVSLTSSSSYLDFRNEGVLALAPATAADSSIPTDLSANTFSQEMNLSSNGQGPWRWTAGGIYRDSSDRRRQSLAGLASPKVEKYTSKSWALFGELTRSLFDGQLELTAGVRRFQDDVTLTEESRFGSAPATNLVSRDTSYRKTTPRVIVTWKPRSEAMVYASYSEGFRSGVEQLPNVVLALPSLGPALPDLLKNYEAGTKATFWNGRADTDVAVYYLDWRDVQLPFVVSTGVGSQAAIINSTSASGVGSDVAFNVRPIDGLQVGLTASWNSLEVDQPVEVGSIVLFTAGDRLNYSSEYTLGGSLDYSFPLGGSGLTGGFSASVNHTSPRTFKSLVGSTVFASTGDPITIGRLSLSLDAPSGWRTMLFVDNVADEKGSVSGTLGLTQPWWATRIRPRTIGLQLEYHY